MNAEDIQTDRQTDSDKRRYRGRYTMNNRRTFSST